MIPLFKVAMAPTFPQLETTLHSGFVGQGPRVDEFETRLETELNLPSRPVSLNSCTSALDLALHLEKVGRGDYVISTPQTCLATNTVIHNRGATIVWADIDPITGNIDPQDVAYLAHKYRPKAIIAVDWSGRPCDYIELRKSGVVIEDAAHAFGAPTGGDYVCYSFQAIKHLTTGDGGALVTRQTDRARLLRWYGLDRTIGTAMRCTQLIKEIGYKYQMNDLAASIGLANLDIAKANVVKHRANAHYYSQHMANEKITLPPFDANSAWWIFTVHVDTRDDFMAHCLSRNIEASLVHVRNDIQPELRAVQAWPGELPGVESFSKTQVSIPCGWWLSDSDRDFIVDVVNSY